MAGITQNSFETLFPLWSLKKTVVGYIDLEQKETYKKLKIEVSDIVSDTGILIMLFHKLNTTLFNRNYSQNSKAITFRKIINHTTYT